MTDKELARAIGRMEGKMDLILKNQSEDRSMIKALDSRLQTQERKSAVMGTVGGTVAGIGVSLLAQMFKANIN